MDQGYTIEQGTVSDFLELVLMNYYDYRQAPPTALQPTYEFLYRLLRSILDQNSLNRARKNVAHHYDLSAQFFKLFLDNDMQYSCAYFTDWENNLDQAQLDKKRLIASKLLLKPGMHVFDIGCGFGGMAIFLAKNYGVEVTGVTLSEEQHKLATERVAQAGLDHLVKIRLLDYRQESGTYDRIVSVGMFEHVGVENYKQFFDKVKMLLKDDGVALLHSMGRMHGPTKSEKWVTKHIFPGGYVPAFSEVIPVVEKTGLWATDVEILRLHYAQTLKLWHDNFNWHRDAVKEMYDERFCRMWEMYLAAFEMYFRYMGLMVFQLQMAKRIDVVPLTRTYMYEEMTRLTSAERSQRTQNVSS
jgi:cyclopropane-fatty-acyl-phospholipid synthase